MADKRPQFGGRLLTDPQKVFEHNAWDNVVWDAEQEEEAQRKVDENSRTVVPPDMQEKYEKEANKFWDEFYTQHQNKFFKDRQWLFTEFPELAPGVKLPTDIPKEVHAEPGPANSSAPAHVGDEGKSEVANPTAPHADSEQESPAAATSEAFPGQSATFRVFEVGCGVGNTVFPVLQTNNDPGLFVYCCDLSATAIDLVKEHPDYDVSRCSAFVCDVASPDAQFPFPAGSLDVVILIFVLSAIHPNKMQATVARLATLLKPGGRILLRDYGRYDMAQLRFKQGKCLQENFYVRSDGTRVYFFTQDDLRELFTASGLQEEQNLVDRRLQVNRGRQLKMYRVWIQCKYRKPAPPDDR